MNIKILKPNINYSGSIFTIELDKKNNQKLNISFVAIIKFVRPLESIWAIPPFPAAWLAKISPDLVARTHSGRDKLLPKNAKSSLVKKNITQLHFKKVFYISTK